MGTSKGTDLWELGNEWVNYMRRFDLVPRVQFEKRQKHPWRNDTFSQITG